MTARQRIVGRSSYNRYPTVGLRPIWTHIGSDSPAFRTCDLRSER
jgi:hypothetical protein